MAEKEKLDLKKVLNTLDPDRLTKEDFEAALKEVVSFVNEFTEGLTSALEKLSESIPEAADSIKGESANERQQFRSEAQSIFNALSEGASARLNEIEARINARAEAIRDGIDADPEDVKNRVLAEIVLPSNKEIMLDTPEDIRNKLELLQGDERLDASAIKGLRRLIKKVGGSGGTFAGGGGVHGRDLIQDYDLSSQLDGVTKTFPIPATWNIISVTLSSFPTVLRKGIDYTWTPTSITFTDEIDAASTLAAGQTAVLTLVTG